MKRKKILRISGLSLLALLLAFQFVPVDRTHPESDPNNDFIHVESPPEEVANLLKTSCYDCHSNQPVYPWYAYVAPVSWRISEHIEHGSEELNFSDWGTYPPGKKDHKLEEMVEEVEEGEMPLWDYKLAHSEADLTNDQVQLLTRWFEEKRAEIQH